MHVYFVAFKGRSQVQLGRLVIQQRNHWVQTIWDGCGGSVGSVPTTQPVQSSGIYLSKFLHWNNNFEEIVNIRLVLPFVCLQNAVIMEFRTLDRVSELRAYYPIYHYTHFDKGFQWHYIPAYKTLVYTAIPLYRYDGMPYWWVDDFILCCCASLWLYNGIPYCFIGMPVVQLFKPFLPVFIDIQSFYHLYTGVTL